MSGNTQTGDVLEQMVLPALKRGGYQCQRQSLIGKRPSGNKHYVDALVTGNGGGGALILVSSKWQEVSGTAEQKVPFEVICLIAAMRTGKYSSAYLVLGGPGWTLRKFYLSGGLNPFIIDVHLVKILSLESFISLANQGKL